MNKMINIKLSFEEELVLFSKELKKVFSKGEIEHMARMAKFVQRKGKLDAWQFVALCSFMNVNVAKDTLVTLASTISANDGPTVSCQAIDQRLNEKCVNFLKQIFNKLLMSKILSGASISSKIDKYFNRILILDSTSFQIPEIHKAIYPGSGGNSQPAGIKIQLEFELKSGEFIDIETGPGLGSDNNFGKKVNPTIESGDLILKDLGYFSIEDFNEIEKKEAFYISRLKPNISVYVKNDKIEYYKNGIPKKSSLYRRIFINDIMKKMDEGTYLEMGEVFLGKEKELKTRLVVYKLTKEQLEKRKKKSEKTAKKKGITKSKNTIELLGVSLYITNISEEILKAEQIYETYTLRWQVEIIFKTWKSIFHIQNVKPVKIERLQCQLYGKLILILLTSTIMFKMRVLLFLKEKREASEIKLAEIVYKYIKGLYMKLINSQINEILNLLIKIFQNALKNGKKSHRKGKKTVFDILGVSYNGSKIKFKKVA